MLKITVPATEQYDEATSSFITTKAQDLQLEHSLVSLSKWESKWHKPFLEDNNKTSEEIMDYIRCMTLTQNVNPDVYAVIPNDVIDQVIAYINDPMTATTINDSSPTKGRRQIVTAEVIYYSMIALQIPFECQKWHLNRLMTLIRVCEIKNSPPKKMSKNAIYAQNRSLNQARRAAMGSKG